jgi:hypothetical protein
MAESSQNKSYKPIFFSIILRPCAKQPDSIGKSNEKKVKKDVAFMPGRVYAVLVK